MFIRDRLTDVKFQDGDYKAPIVNTYNQYLADREVLYKGRDDKFVCLMDLALMAMKKLKSEGKLQDQDVYKRQDHRYLLEHVPIQAYCLPFSAPV